MGKRVEFYDPETWDLRESSREYGEYTVTAIQHAEDSYGNDRGISMKLFVDSSTGVVVADVALYEASLGDAA
jgi:hypothetical protein